MGGRIIRAAVIVLLSIIFRLLLKNIFNLRLSHDTELL